MITEFGQEFGIEIFYRLQLTNAVTVLPDLQYWLRDYRDSDAVCT
jgi:hypothetical protein